VKVRVVAATNRDLDDEVRAGRFREDLLFRLKGTTLIVPPLRDRPLDIPLLAQDLLDAARTELNLPLLAIAESTMFCILRHSWPGNVRELKHAMQNIALVRDTGVVTVADLPDSVFAGANELPPKLAPPVGASQFPPDFSRSLEQELDELKRMRMFQALQATHGVVSRAAKLLSIPRRTFFAWMKKYGLERVDA
jgi:DNA-binding NtrC family response regulator